MQKPGKTVKYKQAYNIKIMSLFKMKIYIIKAHAYLLKKNLISLIINQLMRKLIYTLNFLKSTFKIIKNFWNI